MKTSACLFLFLLITYPLSAQKRNTYKVLNYLNVILGKKTLSGTHNREPNARPARWTDKVNETTGHYPALWSGDFLFQQDNINNRQLMIDEAVRQWQKGAVVNIMWHACNPAQTEPCGWKGGVLSKLTDAQWAEITTNGSPLNKVWMSRVDEICIYLQQLKDKNIEVLWRPMHEMNQGDFWWGGRPGPQGTVKLYQMLHNYMVKQKKLTNLIWVWDVQDFKTLATDVTAYQPEAAYWDVAALDIYDKSGYADEKYNIMLKAVKGKPMAIGECSKLPDEEVLMRQPKWAFFMSWSELAFQDNSVEQIKALHAAPNVLNLDKMPGWTK
ncbi:glycoside hydrolase family 26 protein [Mucilaginibacter antarcticus]|uniref:Glycoside hydrolase family 26 protein n=1 Tax=Mucilaginibacter antarcticus TaxID=1855725 RepID=A0ABW5XR74_9SPHI